MAVANANVALVKYWGKCDEALHLPATSSLSFTLDHLGTHTQVLFTEDAKQDTLWVNNQLQSQEITERVSTHIDLITQRKKQGPRAYVSSWNNIPTSSGLASSSSAFAALTLAVASAWFGGENSPSSDALAMWTRQGSGSAARSLLGGLVYLPAGRPGDSASSLPLQIVHPEEWSDLRMVLGIVTEAPKKIGSRKAMLHTQRTSPYHAPFIQESQQDAKEALQAIKNRDIVHLGEVTERSALRMHGNLWAAHPGIVYFRGATLEAFHVIQELRQQGHLAWFTCDAGPHPKALTTANSVTTLCKAMEAIPGIQRILVSSLGRGAYIVP